MEHDRLTARLEASSGRSGGAPALVAVAMANNPEVIGCIGTALARGVARFLLVGPAGETRDLACEHSVDIDGAEFLEESAPVAACRFVARLASEGRADVVMKGLVQTGDFMRALLDRSLGLVPPGGLLSHVALFDIPTYSQLLLLTDAAITTQPDEEQKIGLIRNALQVALALGLHPVRIALVAPVERISDKVPSTVDAGRVVERFRASLPTGCSIDGPFGLDVAVSSESARIKGIEGPVAGRANLLVLPGLDAANVLYKSLTCFCAAAVAGVVAGASIPVVLTSRADSESNKYLSLLLALSVRLAKDEQP